MKPRSENFLVDVINVNYPMALQMIESYRECYRQKGFFIRVRPRAKNRAAIWSKYGRVPYYAEKWLTRQMWPDAQFFALYIYPMTKA